MHRTLTGLTALLLLVGCAGGDRNQDQRPPSGFESAARLVDRGQYAEALPVLRCIAHQGQGFEIAQYLAGHSALELSRAETTAAVLRDDLRVEGFERLMAAGHAGWPAAQAELAAAFASNDGEQALAEAAFWAALYRRNTRERAYGLDRLDNSVEAAIETRLDEDGRRAATVRADAFSPTPLEREPTTPDCAAHIRSGRGPGGEQRRARPPGGRGTGGGDGVPQRGGSRPGGPYR